MKNDAQVNFRVSADLLRDYRDIAAEDGMSVSGSLRRHMFAAAYPEAYAALPEGGFDTISLDPPDLVPDGRGGTDVKANAARSGNTEPIEVTVSWDNGSDEIDSGSVPF